MWQYPKQIPGQSYSIVPVRCCVASNGKTKFFACLGRKLVGLDWKGGGLEPLWEYDTGGHIPGSPVLASDDLIRVHAGDGMLHCVDQSGHAAWSPVDVGEPLGWAAPIVDQDGNAYISCYSGGLIKVDSRGTLESTPYFRTRQKFDCTGLIHQGVLYVGSEDAYIYAIELGENRGKNTWDHFQDRGKTEWFINSAPALSPDLTLVVAGRDENLYGFYLDGKQAWKVYIPGQMLSHPVIGPNGDIYVGVSTVRFHQSDRGKLVCIDGSSHRVRWEYEANGAVESTPVVGEDSVIYFGDNSGHIHAVRGDGKCVWRQNVKSPVRSAGSIVGPNRLVFGLDNGTMVGILCSSGGIAPSGWPKYIAKSR